MKRYFITGTNTDCGKTYVTCQLLSFLNKDKQKAMAIKPVATGCNEHDGVLISEDVQQIEKHQDTRGIDLCPWRFSPPISPHLAAREAGTSLNAETIADFCNKASAPGREIILIEGAGGLMVPLNETETWVDFLKLTQFPVIIVVGMRLGCINHALLTAALLKTEQIECAGWVANCLDKDMLFLNDNIDYLKKNMNMRCLGKISYNGRVDDWGIDC